MVGCHIFDRNGNIQDVFGTEKKDRAKTCLFENPIKRKIYPAYYSIKSKTPSTLSIHYRCTGYGSATDGYRQIKKLVCGG
jgi:hypothetical protein